MQLADSVQEEIRRYVVGLVSADDLSDWLDMHAQAIHDEGGRWLRQFADLAHSLLEDVFQGHRTDEDVRSVLSAELPLDSTVSAFEDAFQGAVSYSTSGTTSTVTRASMYTAAWGRAETTHLAHAS